MSGRKIIDGLNELLDFVCGNTAGLPVVVYIPDKDGRLVKHTVWSMDELARLQERDALAPSPPPER